MGFGEHGGKWHLFQGNKGQFWGDKDNIQEQGTQENKFSIFVYKPIYFR